jgi:hypothetical protein
MAKNSKQIKNGNFYFGKKVKATAEGGFGKGFTT